MKITEILPNGVSYNPEGQMIDAIVFSGEPSRILCVRAFGRCLQMSGGDIAVAGKIQDQIGRFVSEAINEKLHQESKGDEQSRILNHFRELSDIRYLLLSHPDKDLITRACLHFLGDDAQIWWNERSKSKQ